MSGDDVTELRRLMERLGAALDAHIQQGSERAEALDRRVSGIETRMSAIEKDLPALIETKIEQMFTRQATRIRNLILWFIPIIMGALAVIQAMNK